MKASTLINILAHLSADAEIILGEAESAIAAEFRKLVSAHVADKVLPPAPVPLTPVLRTDGPTAREEPKTGG